MPAFAAVAASASPLDRGVGGVRLGRDPCRCNGAGTPAVDLDLDRVAVGDAGDDGELGRPGRPEGGFGLAAGRGTAGRLIHQRGADPALRRGRRGRGRGRARARHVRDGTEPEQGGRDHDRDPGEGEVGAAREDTSGSPGADLLGGPGRRLCLRRLWGPTVRPVGPPSLRCRPEPPARSPRRSDRMWNPGPRSEVRDLRPGGLPAAARSRVVPARPGLLARQWRRLPWSRQSEPWRPVVVLRERPAAQPR